MSVDDWAECPVCDGSGCAAKTHLASHEWDEDGERCIKCGDKDWMADELCSEWLVRMTDKQILLIASKTLDADTAPPAREVVKLARALFAAAPAPVAQSAGVPEGEYKRMFEDAVRSLAAIDEALGIDPDEAGGAAPILEAIAELKYRAAPAPVSEPTDMPEGCTPADAEMLRAANHALAAEIDRLKRRLRPFAQLASSPLSWAMVEYCIKDDPEKQTLQAPQMQRAFNRAVEALNENTEQQPVPMMDFGESGLVAEMLEALEAVVSVADRATIEFDKARAAIERARTARNADASPSRECGERQGTTLSEAALERAINAWFEPAGLRTDGTIERAKGE